MSSVYTRPELTKSDLKAFQAAKYVALNPTREDILKGLKVAEKSSRKNRLSEQEALDAFDRFTDQKLETAFAGNYYCEPHWQYPIQCTVIQLVRLSDSITGLIFDRQQVEQGQTSTPPLLIESTGLLSGKNPLKILNSALAYFWPYLSDTALDELHNQCSLYVMETLVPERQNALAQQHELLATRKTSIAELYRGIKPEFATEFSQQCSTIAKELQHQNKDSIKWSDLKKQYPAISSRHKAQLLSILENNNATVEALSSAKYNTDFDVRLTTWRGEMRLFDNPQLVLQIRNIPVHHRLAKHDSPRYGELSNDIKAQARNLRHPATENTIGWLRIHIDDENKLCFVDEVQSDAMELAREYLTDPRYTNAAQEFINECSPWNLHAFATVYQWANNKGYQPAIHSRESAEKIKYMTKSERKWVNNYNAIIKKFALRKESIDQYPADIFVGE